MNSSWPQAALGNFESPSFTEQDVRDRHANIFKGNFGVPMWRMVVAENSEQALYFDSRGIHGHQYHGLLLMPGSGRIRLSHEDRDSASRISCPRGPPLASIDDVFVALPNDARLDIGRVRRSHRGFGHRVTRSDLAGEQGL